MGLINSLSIVYRLSKRTIHPRCLHAPHGCEERSQLLAQQALRNERLNDLHERCVVLEEKRDKLCRQAAKRC